MTRFTNDFKGKLNTLFAALRKRGFFARQNFSCCSSCACYEISEIFKKDNTPNRPYVFYHHQDAELVKDGEVFLRYETLEDGNAIVEEAKKVGLGVDWNNDRNTAIKVQEVKSEKFINQTDGI